MTLGNPRGAWLSERRATPVSVAPFGLTETGAGGFFGHQLEHNSLQPSSWTAVPGGTLLAAQRLMTKETWMAAHAAAVLHIKHVCSNSEAQAVDLAELVGVGHISYSCATGMALVLQTQGHNSYVSPKADGGTRPQLERPRP